MSKKFEFEKVTIEVTELGERKHALIREGTESEPKNFDEPSWAKLKVELTFYLKKYELASEEEIRKLDAEAYDPQK